MDIPDETTFCRFCGLLNERKLCQRIPSSNKSAGLPPNAIGYHNPHQERWLDL